MSDPKTILAIAAHPDDVEFQCAGTLTLLHQAGHRIHIATMTAGDCGSMNHSPEEIQAIRRKEAAAAADILDAGYTCLEELDLSIEHDSPTRRKVTRLLREVRPDIVITHMPMDYMADHEKTSENVRDACFNASVPNYYMAEYKDTVPMEHVPHLYYMDALESIDRFGQRIAPHFFVDISDAMETKKEMLACHASQREWLREQHGIDEYILSMERWAEERGKEVGTKYAESYRQHLGHGYPHDNILAEWVKVLSPPTS